MRYIRDIIVTTIAAIVIFTLLQSAVGGFKVYGQCMVPNVLHGDYVMLNKVVYRFQEPSRGDVIVFKSPRDLNTRLIKRIIGLPGETVEIVNGTVYINGAALEEPYIAERPTYAFARETIPYGHYFVLGDNRNNSADSHTGFTVPRENVMGRAWFDYWPPSEWGIVKHYIFQK